MRARPRPSNPGAGAGTGKEATPARVTVVESEGCHFCIDARQVLRGAAARFPLELHTVDIRSSQGQELMRAHGATMSPLVLLDGRFFSNGRLPRRKLAKVLGQRFAVPSPATAAAQDGVHHG